MNTIITLYIIGYIFFVYMNYKQKSCWNRFVIFYSLLQSLLFAIVGLIIAIALPVKYETTTQIHNIASLKVNIRTNGHFYLFGSYFINESIEYVFYIENDDSTYQLREVDYKDAKIKYATTDPRVVITDIHSAKNAWNKWAIDITDKSHQTYIIEVQQGLIQNSYGVGIP